MRFPRSPSRRLALACLLCSAVAAPAGAGDTVNTIVVTTTTDALDAFDQKCSLREALANANGNNIFSPVVSECSGGSALMTDVLMLADGATYPLTLAGVGDDAGDLDVLFEPFVEDLEDHLRLVVADEGTATIEQQVGGYRVMEIHGAQVGLYGVTIRGGSSPGVGGGILNTGGSLLLDTVTLASNSALAGGGLYNDGFATIRDSELLLNAAGFTGGGAVFNDDEAELQITATLIRANTGAEGAGIYNNSGFLRVLAGTAVNLNSAIGDGGGIYLFGAGDVRIEEASFEGNAAGGNGGAIANDSPGDLPVVDSDFRLNQAGLDGGAIWSVGTTDVSTLHGSFEDNEAQFDGGAIRANSLDSEGTVFRLNSAGQNGGAVSGGLTVRFDNAMLVENDAVRGGAVHGQFVHFTDTEVTGNHAVVDGGGAHSHNAVYLTGSRLEGNSADGDGGGVYLDGGPFTSNVTRSLFRGNVALGDGGGMWVSGSPLATLSNSTFSGNSAGTGGGGLFIADDGNVLGLNLTLASNSPGGDLAKYGELALGNSLLTTPGQDDCTVALENPEIDSLGHNLSDDDSCIGLDEPSDQVEVNVLLDVLANNGGNTLTHALLPGSPAIDAGDPVTCTGVEVYYVDQRGAGRAAEEACDIGAHEQGAVPDAGIFSDGFE